MEFLYTMGKKGCILIADDKGEILESLKQLLKYDYAQIITTDDPEQIPAILAQYPIDLVLLDMNFTPGATSGKEGLHWLQKILDHDPLAVVVPMTAYGDIHMAVNAMKAGGIDFIVKPWDPPKLMATIASAFQLRQSRLEVNGLRETRRIMDQDIHRQFDLLVGSSQEVERMKELTSRAASSDASILITGENGSGKELIARQIHLQSSRSGESFVGVDLGSLNESLFESEMFGHQKGAFTDAHRDHIGRFEIASEGTLFLDEIGNLSMHLQSKLLRVLEENIITPVGSNHSRSIDIRLISATNRNLNEMILGNVFREDLYFRINTIEIRVPPLRERQGDIPLLLDYFLRKFEQKYNKSRSSISGKALEALSRYHWPGNIRELKHMSEKAVVMNETGILEPQDFFSPSLSTTQNPSDQLSSLADLERAAIKDALSKFKGNISQAASLLEISRSTLYSKMEKHGL
jgi:DNA-binding NtrC family response regulator